MSTIVILVKDTSFAGPDTTRDIHNAFVSAIKAQGLESSVQAVRASDLGAYDKGVVARVLPGGTTYAHIQESDVAEIVTAASKGNVVNRILHKPGYEPIRIVLRNCGVIDPESIEDYLSHDGYKGLARAVTTLTPEQVIDEMKTSGLRGRGGAGFPTWMKWNLARKSVNDTKYVICNGDEGDPGAYMDRSVLEGDPHSVIEGMLIAGYAIGAKQGFFYIRAEYPLAITRIQNAINQAYARGYLGKNILGTGFSFDTEIRLGAGAFVCGEETALIQSIEGKRGMPRARSRWLCTKATCCFRA